MLLRILIISILTVIQISCSVAQESADNSQFSRAVYAPQKDDQRYTEETAAWEHPLPVDFESDYEIMDSGGTLIPEQSAYRVYYYDLNFGVNPADSTLSGNVATYAEIVHPADELVLDFDTTFTINRLFVLRDGEPLNHASYQNRGGQLWIKPGKTLQPGDQVELRVWYEGRPRVAENAPWDGGFVWDRTETGEPWVGVACQVDGANIWWPVKDHPSDRADSVSISVTIPEGLTAASNGRLRDINHNDDGTDTWNWFVSTPINNYAVTVNIAPYKEISRTYESVTGEDVPFYFWALPENADKARDLIPDIKSQLRHYEELLGPYPFRGDKYGVVEAPYFGMEHQTLIAYGAGYEDDTTFDTGSGFDDLHHHELGHEWWANLVSAADWKDFWIHEGFCTYMSPLYAEHLHDRDQYHHFMYVMRSRIDNIQPVASRSSASTRDAYVGRDIYFKGAWKLHTLRYLMGDEAFMKSLRRMAYPEEEMETFTDGRQCRFASADDYINLVSDLSGEDMEWFFNVYLYSAELPELIREEQNGQTYLYWQTPDDLPFEIPVELKVDGELITKTIGKEAKAIANAESEVVIDPDNWILRAGQPGTGY